MGVGINARAESDLAWYYEVGQDEIKALRSTWNDSVVVKADHVAGVFVDGHWYELPPLRCGPIYVSQKKHAHHATYELSPRALAAARKYDRIDKAIRESDRWAAYAQPPWPCPVPPSTILRLRFREPMPAALSSFGLAGAAGRRDRPMNSALGVAKPGLRGAGNLAHLTADAHQAHAGERTELQLDAWLVRLGSRLERGKATPGEQAVRSVIARAAEALEVLAAARYLQALNRVPERVVRAAQARSA